MMAWQRKPSKIAGIVLTLLVLMLQSYWARSKNTVGSWYLEMVRDGTPNQYISIAVCPQRGELSYDYLSDINGDLMIAEPRCVFNKHLILPKSSLESYAICDASGLSGEQCSNQAMEAFLIKNDLGTVMIPGFNNYLSVSYGKGKGAVSADHHGRVSVWNGIFQSVDSTAIQEQLLAATPSAWRPVIAALSLVALDIRESHAPCKESLNQMVYKQMKQKGSREIGSAELNELVRKWCMKGCMGTTWDNVQRVLSRRDTWIARHKEVLGATIADSMLEKDFNYIREISPAPSRPG